MIKFVLILISVVSFNFVVSFTTTMENPQPNEVAVIFSNEAVAIESGQPVFTKGTKVWVTNPKKEDIKVYLNEKEDKISDDKVDLSQITHLNEGTYTLVLNTNSEEKVFGFTIQ